MTYFSEIDQDGIVKRTVSVADSVKDGAKFITSLLGGLWVESTKTAGRLRAGIGYKYLPRQKGFQAPQPYASWSFNEDDWQWEPPVPMPADNDFYYWDEQSTAWKKVLMEDSK